jgi:hypothetical protein
MTNLYRRSSWFKLGYYYIYYNYIHKLGYLSGVRLGYGLDGRGFKSRQGLRNFLLTTVSKLALGPTQPPIQSVPGAISLGVKRPVREADHSSPSSAKVMNAWSYISTPPMRLHGVIVS